MNAADATISGKLGVVEWSSGSSLANTSERVTNHFHRSRSAPINDMTVTRAMLGVLCWAWLGMDSLWAVGPCVETFRDLQVGSHLLS